MAIRMIDYRKRLEAKIDEIRGGIRVAQGEKDSYTLRRLQWELGAFSQALDWTRRIRTPDPEGDVSAAAQLAFDTMYDDARKGGASEEVAHKLGVEAYRNTINHLQRTRMDKIAASVRMDGTT